MARPLRLNIPMALILQKAGPHTKCDPALIIIY